MEGEVYEARLNSAQMLRDRGYRIAPEVSDIPFHEFAERVKTRSLVDLYAERQGESAFVRFLHPCLGLADGLKQTTIDKEIAEVGNTVNLPTSLEVADGQLMETSLVGSDENVVAGGASKRTTDTPSSAASDALDHRNRLHIIFVCKCSPLKAVQQIITRNYPDVEWMLFSQLQINPTRHFLVPKHELMPPDEELAFLKRLNPNGPAQAKRELPRICRTDPIVRWYGFRVNQVCKITRTSEQTGRSIYFRLVSS